MTAVAIVGGIGTLVGANQADKASQRATRAQVNASNRALDLTSSQFDQTKESLDPFIQGSAGAFQEQQALSGALGPEAEAAAQQRLTSGAGFQFLQQQGEGDINRSAAVGGNLGSGTRLKALSQFRSNLLSQQRGDRLNQLGGVSRQGLGAAQALGGFGSQQAGQQANLLGQQGLAQAQGAINRGNAFQSGLEGIGQTIGNIAGGFGSSTNIKEV